MSLPFAPPAALSPAFRMSGVMLGDIEELVNIQMEAFSADPANIYWWSPNRDVMRAWLGERLRNKLFDPDVRYFKINDIESGDLVAWARWQVPDGFTGLGDGVSPSPYETNGDAQAADGRKGNGGETERKSEQEEKDEELSPEAMARRKLNGVHLPEGANREAFTHFFVEIFRLQARHGAQKMLQLSLLCTAPAYERRGAARALLEPVLAVAENQGITTWLEGTPGARGLYEKLGFRAVDEMVADTSTGSNGLMGTYVLTCMRRDPKINA